MANSNPDLANIKKKIKEQELLIEEMQEHEDWPFEIEGYRNIERLKRAAEDLYRYNSCGVGDEDFPDDCERPKDNIESYGESINRIKNQNRKNQIKLDEYRKAQTELNRLKELVKPSQGGGRKLRRRRIRRTRKGAKKSKKRKRRRRTKRRKTTKKSRRLRRTRR